MVLISSFCRYTRITLLTRLIYKYHSLPWGWGPIRSGKEERRPVPDSDRTAVVSADSLPGSRPPPRHRRGEQAAPSASGMASASALRPGPPNSVGLLRLACAGLHRAPGHRATGRPAAGAVPRPSTGRSVIAPARRRPVSYQRAVSRNPMPCSGSLSLAVSRRVVSSEASNDPASRPSRVRRQPRLKSRPLSDSP